MGRGGSDLRQFKDWNRWKRLMERWTLHCIWSNNCGSIMNTRFLIDRRFSCINIWQKCPCHRWNIKSINFKVLWMPWLRRVNQKMSPMIKTKLMFFAQVFNRQFQQSFNNSKLSLNRSKIYLWNVQHIIVRIQKPSHRMSLGRKCTNAFCLFLTLKRCTKWLRNRIFDHQSIALQRKAYLIDNLLILKSLGRV